MYETDDDSAVVLRKVRRWLWFFLVCLVLSGLTAFPLEAETRLLVDFATGPAAPLAEHFPAATAWFERVHTGIVETDERYPFSGGRSRTRSATSG
ncbi:hypothetical protein [Kitasatospora sp. NPDC085464]|uniref:hypothetical protein n=1 Tax=Kitasatospora sp. NPDC085464 TaxID=3364063 RepID=UPI0037C85371